ncbi:MAG: M1 family metallopeptidase [Candidatus Cloacimonetes bacterium]|nr:M1 family metallopeptidase [Candidatus Cloacimonadota bacterium]
MKIALLALLFAAQADTAYFQQDIAYRIEATLDEGTDVLTARARLDYTNNSPDTLDSLYFHLELNAFRPNSAWARRELEYGERRFQDLGPDDHAFERITAIRVGDTPVRPEYRGAPDSTVVAIALPQPLPPGARTTVMIDWQTRLATEPRRQGRRGRHHDFAQWYPRIAVYDHTGWATRPLLPQGEFYGEYGTFDVTLDVAADQVIGATGVPVEGDPGWAAARAGGPEPWLKRDAYDAPAPQPLGLLDDAPAEGRKRVRWYAEDVHHFAWTANPDYIYEGGRIGDVAVHVLYQPGDTAWDDGVAVEHTKNAIAFFSDLFGPYPWPQITNVHRIEPGGTEFPMMIMDGSASEGLIVHEIAHQWVHGIFGNNEWREGWLDEGFGSFLTNWYFEAKGVPPSMWDSSLEGIRRMERAGQSQPIALESAEFRDPRTYSAMTYTKPSLVFRMLRDYLGEDTFRRALKVFYERKALQHVTEQDLRAAFETAAGEDLDWFFDQWIHTTATLDYRIESARARQEGSEWVATIEVAREGDAWMPVTLQVDGSARRLDSREPRQVVTLRLTERPTQAVLDPDNILLDIQIDNNRAAFEVTGSR